MTIFSGGHDLKELSPEWFRSKVAIVSQEPTLFACSIKDNIGYGREHAEMDEVITSQSYINNIQCKFISIYLQNCFIKISLHKTLSNQ